METFQNRGKGFDVGEEFGGFLIKDDVADQSTKRVDRRHTGCDVVDQQISNFFRLKETKRNVSTRTLDYKFFQFQQILSNAVAESLGSDSAFWVENQFEFFDSFHVREDELKLLICDKR